MPADHEGDTAVVRVDSACPREMRYVPPEPQLPFEPERPPRRTNTKLAVLLALLFGPLGLFYASWRGGLFMSFVFLVVGIATVGVGLLFAWPVCIFWAYATAGNS